MLNDYLKQRLQWMRHEADVLVRKTAELRDALTRSDTK